jgi:outer membrane protein TolC
MLRIALVFLTVSVFAQQLPEFSLPAGSPLAGSIPSAATPGAPLTLTLDDAITRGLRYNLSLVESGEDVRLRRAERLRALSALLPTLSLRPSITEQQVNLAALGFTGFPGIPSVIGPFTVYDARAYGESQLSFQAWRNLKAANETINSAELDIRDLREQVALVVTAAYLQALAGAARIDAQRALVNTAETELRQARDRKNAGTVPAIDVLRAQVQAQVEQQRLIAYEGAWTKQKLTLARAIGLPPGQEYELAEKFDYSPLPSDFNLGDTIRSAWETRADVKAAQSRVRAAELRRSAAEAGRLPSVGVDANYGTNGLSPAQLHGSFAVAAGVNIPVFTGGRVRAEVDAATTAIRQAQARLDNLRSQIDAEIRSAFTDIQTAARQVEVARSNRELAAQELQQAQDRFAAGVTNNLEVVQAQQSVAAANDSWISSQYAYEAAKAALLRARGDGEQTIRNMLRSTK